MAGVVPRSREARSQSRTRSRSPAGRPERTAPAEVASRSLTGSATVAAAAPRTQAALVYRVKRGDTLSSIAQLFDTTVSRIRSLNRLRGNAVVAGTRLKIAH